jgi:hypothetical protein
MKSLLRFILRCFSMAMAVLFAIIPAILADCEQNDLWMLGLTVTIPLSVVCVDKICDFPQS